MITYKFEVSDLILPWEFIFDYLKFRNYKKLTEKVSV